MTKSEATRWIVSMGLMYLVGLVTGILWREVARKINSTVFWRRVIGGIQSQPSERSMSDQTNFVQIGEPICTCGNAKYLGCLKHFPTPVASAKGITLVQAMRAAALGMQTAGLDPFGVVSHGLSDGADALGMLHSAVKGCGYHVPRSARRPPYNCGEDDGISIKLCGQCEIKRDMAIRTITSATDGTK